MKYFVSFFVVTFFATVLSSQDIDPDDLLNKLERLERNITDLIKNKTEKSLKSGYISRNEKRFDGIETDLQKNFGKIENVHALFLICLFTDS